MTPISGMAAVRAADAMLQTLGGTAVILLFAAAGLPDGCESELGLVDPGVAQVPMAPVIVRELPTENNGPRRRIELVIGRAAMAEAMNQRNITSAEELLETALGMVFDGDMFYIEGHTVERFAGVAYLYRVVAVE